MCITNGTAYFGTQVMYIYRRLVKSSGTSIAVFVFSPSTTILVQVSSCHQSLKGERKYSFQIRTSPTFFSVQKALAIQFPHRSRSLRSVQVEQKRSSSRQMHSHLGKRLTPPNLHCGCGQDRSKNLAGRLYIFILLMTLRRFWQRPILEANSH